MKKGIKFLIIVMASLSLLYLIIAIALVAIEEYIETNIYHIMVYNYTNDEMVITINDKYTINVEKRTNFWDKIFSNEVLNKDNKYNNNYLIKSNGNILFDKKMDGFNVIRSFSARGGLITSIVINKTDENNYDIIFTRNESEIGNWLELKRVQKSKWWMDFFNSDGLHQ